MFKITLLLALVAFAAAVPIRVEEDKSLEKTEAPEIIAILKSESNQNADGSYNFLYESSDGNFREENAEIINTGSEETSGIKITGSYKYIDANGDEVVVTYTADENGFVPVGTNINKEISDAAIAARDLPKQEEPAPKPVGRSLKLVDEAKEVVKPKIVPQVKAKAPEVKAKVAEVVKPKVEPEVKPKEPEVKPKEPEVKPKEPEVKPKEPEVKPQEPEVKPKEPEVKPKEPEVKANEPEVKVKEPEVKPKVAEEPKQVVDVKVVEDVPEAKAEPEAVKKVE